MLTVREHSELRAFYARFPFDDEANHQLPTALLRAQILEMFKAGGSAPVSVLNLLPFRPRENQGEDDDDPEWLRSGKGW